MAPRLSGFTRASSLGPIGQVVERQGGSIARVLRAVDLPFAILEQPDIVIPLREQFKLLERAARETGDEWFGARLGQAARAMELSSFGVWVCSADTLLQAMERAHASIGKMLQTSTILSLAKADKMLRWSIEFVEPETTGRQHNELLGLGYMMDAVRSYAGRNWRPNVVRVTLPKGSPCSALEEIFGTNVSTGHAVSSITFDGGLLSAARGARPQIRDAVRPSLAPQMPNLDDLPAALTAVAELALCDGYPRIDWIAPKLGMSRRSLQRHLGDCGTTFNRAIGEAMQRRACELLDDGTKPVTCVAFELGFSDPAHFVRAFRRWTGGTPSAYRRRML